LYPTNGLQENKYSAILWLVEETCTMTTRPRCKTGTGKLDVENCRKSDRTSAVWYYKRTAHLRVAGVRGDWQGLESQRDRNVNESLVNRKLVRISQGNDRVSVRGASTLSRAESNRYSI